MKVLGFLLIVWATIVLFAAFPILLIFSALGWGVALFLIKR